METENIINSVRNFIKDDELLNKTKAIEYPFDQDVSNKIIKIIKQAL